MRASLFKPSLLFCILSSTLTDVQKPTRRSRSRRPTCRCQKLEIAGAPGAHSPARVPKEKHDARARGLERRRHARLALQQTAQSDQDAHPGRGQGSSRCVPFERTGGLPGVLKVDAQSIIVLEDHGGTHRGTKRARIRDTPARSRSSARAVPSASATARDRLPSRRNLQPSAHHLLSSLLSFCPLVTLREY